MTKHAINELVSNKIMFPSKNMDYVGDIQNILSKARAMDGDSTFNYPQSPFQSTMVNRSSSSADSTSPESYFENSLYSSQKDRYNLRIRCETPKLSYESPQRYQRYGSFTNISEPAIDSGFQNFDMSPTYEPFASQYESSSYRMLDTPPIRRHQPIIGRKILGRNLQMQVDNKIAEEQSENVWQSDSLGHTPDRQKNYTLFPTEREFDFNSPIKPPSLSPSRSIKNLSPMTNLSPLSNLSPMTNPLPTYNPRMMNTSNWSPTFGPLQQTKTYKAALNKDTEQKMCTFCRKNGEQPVVYMNHCVKEKRGSAYVVTCPILRSHVCSICGSSGDNAHTLTYCPILRRNNDGKPLKSATITLKNTRTKSNGRQRY